MAHVGIKAAKITNETPEDTSHDIGNEGGKDTGDEEVKNNLRKKNKKKAKEQPNDQEENTKVINTQEKETQTADSTLENYTTNWARQANTNIRITKEKETQTDGCTEEQDTTNLPRKENTKVIITQEKETQTADSTLEHYTTIWTRQANTKVIITKEKETQTDDYTEEQNTRNSPRQENTKVIITQEKETQTDCCTEEQDTTNSPRQANTKVRNTQEKETQGADCTGEQNTTNLPGKSRPLPIIPPAKQNQPKSRPLPIIPPAKQNQPKSPPLSSTTPAKQSHLKSRPLPRITPAEQPTVTADCTEEQQTTISSRKQHHTWNKRTLVESRASSMILGLKGIIMIAAIVLISSSEEISRAESCDFQKALKSIGLNYTASCQYDDIKDESTGLRDWGISLLVVNFLFFLLILFFLSFPLPCKLGVTILILLLSTSSVYTIMKYNDILDLKTAEKDTNYAQLQLSLTVLLEKHYTSDNISSSDVISNNLNKFFIEYNCCAVNQVTGTTNDFDSTPWCTTAGTCQATASQIPKTCCLGVSEDDYVNALSICHSSVSPGTFKSNCMDVIKRLSVVNVEECQLKLVQMSLIIIGSLELVATAFEIMSIIIWILLWNSNKQSAEDEKIKSNGS